MSEYRLFHGDCLDILPSLEDASIDAVICDPPYAEIYRDYGRLTELEWFDLMRPMVRETRRILKPHGSAVFILQPNSSRIGTMRGWLWRFLAWCVEEWNVIQDVYWWNITAQPNGHTWRERGLMRGAAKTCVWLGAPGCYRDQSAVLIQAGDWAKIQKQSTRLEYMPSGYSIRRGRVADVAKERGGSTPFNVLPIPVRSNGAGAHGHGAGTPAQLVNWWLRYITKPGDTVADWCMGSGTTGIEAAKIGRRFIGIERDLGYFDTASERIASAYEPLRAMQEARE